MKSRIKSGSGGRSRMYPGLNRKKMISRFMKGQEKIFSRVR